MRALPWHRCNILHRVRSALPGLPGSIDPSNAFKMKELGGPGVNFKAISLQLLTIFQFGGLWGPCARPWGAHGPHVAPGEVPWDLHIHTPFRKTFLSMHPSETKNGVPYLRTRFNASLDTHPFGNFSSL